LVVTDGPGRGRRYKVGAVATIGRSIGCDVLVDNEEISRRHARLERVGTGYRIEDLGSSNGTFVNGERVVGPTELAFGDSIRIGDNIALILTEYHQDEEEIRQRQRLETVGRLGAGLAHDFNNMQSVITAGLDYVLHLDRDTTLADEKLRDTLMDMMKASERASGLARNLMSYAAADPGSYAIVNVSHVVEEVLRFVTRTFERRISVVTKITPDLNVIGSSAELHQVLMNLAVNARDAMSDGGELTISVELAEAGAIAAMELPPGLQHVLVTVADTGSGMDDATMNRVFDPFFTTKEGATGFGLGLAMVRDVIAAHGGTLGLTSTVGKGTTFRLCLPVAPTAKRRRAKSLQGIPLLAPRLPPDALVLVVDDEEMVRKTMGRILQSAGSRLVFARDGIEAVSVYAKQTSRPDVVILDLDMPGASGESTIDTLLDLDPGARILIVSAHHGGERERAAKSLGAAGFVAKPFNAATLVAATLDAMEEPLEEEDDQTVMVQNE
jgi:signal transduction histidine kinase/ActR/RegA family two-component response regulator